MAHEWFSSYDVAMAQPERPSEHEMADDLMRRVRELSRPPRHIYRLVIYFVSERGRIAASYRFLSHSTDHAADVLQATATLEPLKLAEAEGRTGMIQAFTDAFLEAIERVRREEEWGDVYAAGVESADDTFAEASALEAGSRWRKAI
jgi:hypothetical protein